MAISTVNIGSAPNDGTGDPLRTAFNKLNTNFLNITADGGDEITVVDPTTATDQPLNTALQNIFDSGGGATPDLPTVLAQGNREILKIGDTDETYTTVLADRGKLIYIPSTATVFSEIIIDDVYSLGDTILIYSESGGHTISTQAGGSSFLPSFLGSKIINAGELVSISLLDNTTDNYYTYNVMPYEVTSGATPDLQAVTDVGNSITDGTDTNTVSANGVSVTDFTDTLNLTKGSIEVLGCVNQSILSKDSLYLTDGTDETYYQNGNINNNGVNYPLPTGASSQIATLADITGGVSDGDKGDITVSSSGTVWTIDNGVVDNAKIASGVDAVKIGIGNVDNTEFGYLNGVTSAIQTQIDNRDVLPVLYEKHANVPVFGNASLNNLEGVGFSVQGATSRNFSDTNTYTRRQRLGLTVAITGNLAQARQTATYFNRNSNLDVLIGIGFAENCTNANVRVFAGISTTILFTNVEPTALTNCIGLAKLTTSNNLHLIHNDGSGTATAIDLGASFPSNTVETDFYILRLKTNGSNIDYTVTRVNTGGSTNGSLTTDLPATTQALNLGYYVVQNTGANTTTGIDYFGTNLIKS